MKVGVTGSSGLIAGAVIPHLRQAGHEVVRLVRHAAAKPDERTWNPNGPPDPRLCDGLDAIIHLAGRNIAAGRWTPAQKAAILDSRSQGTRCLADSIARAARRPAVLVSAGAIGIYGDRGDELLTENSAPGKGFLAEVTRAWEAATTPAAAAGVRTVILRFGVVLSAAGGALARMLTPFRFGVGGRLGSGRQWMSWIDLDDAAALAAFALSNDRLHGPVNAVSPHPVRNAEFTATLGRALHRPTIFPVPELAVKALLGEMGKELLLAGQRVQPAVAQAAGFQFSYPELSQALERELQTTSGRAATART